MKKLTLGVLLVSVISILIGCHTSSQVREDALQPMAQSYRGTLPCADCAGIETSLFLDADGTFVLQRQYQTERPGNHTFAVYGKWARTADKLVVTDSEGEKLYFRPLDKGLEMLGRDGVPVRSSSPYRLTATEQPLPVTPMAMRGMYRYMADAALFADCFTGKTYPVVNNVALEKRYLNIRTAPGEPVLLTLEAHYAVSPSPEEGRKVKSVIPGNAEFQMNAGRRCPD